MCCCRSVRFFFSSRRRHTRSLGDWSSDVCSSDLRRQCVPVDAGRGLVEASVGTGGGAVAAPAVERDRSEERRVGKECRYLWSAWHLHEDKQHTTQPLHRVWRGCLVTFVWCGAVTY